MRNYRKILAGVLATSMVLGNSAVVFADEGGSAKGSGKVEGQVKQEVFSVVLPTESDYAGVFDYTIDPMKLITNTDSSKYDASKYKFDAGKTVFFYNGIQEDIADSNKEKLTYTSESNKLEVENKSSVPVKLTVSLSASGAEGIMLSTKSDFTESDNSTANTDPSLYLEIAGTDYSVDSTDATGAHTAGSTTKTAGINSNGVASFEVNLLALTPKTGSTDPAFVTQWNPIRNTYEYVENVAAARITTGFEFSVKGACNPNTAATDWLDALENCVTPELGIIWSISDPTGAQIDSLTQATKTIEMSGFTAEQTYKSLTISDVTGTYDLSGTLAAGAGWDDATGEGALTFTYDDGWKTWMKDKLVTITLNLTDGSSRSITVIGD